MGFLCLLIYNFIITFNLLYLFILSTDSILWVMTILVYFYFFFLPTLYSSTLFSFNIFLNFYLNSFNYIYPFILYFSDLNIFWPLAMKDKEISVLQSCTIFLSHYPPFLLLGFKILFLFPDILKSYFHS